MPWLSASRHFFIAQHVPVYTTSEMASAYIKNCSIAVKSYGQQVNLEKRSFLKQ